MMKLSIYTQNTWLVPFVYSKKKKKRLNDLVSIIKDKEPDIVALQEVTRKWQLNFLKKNITGYEFIHEPFRLFNRSGLLTLSKQKPESEGFILFNTVHKKPQYQKTFKSGALFARFKDFDLFNVHSHAEIKGRGFASTVNDISTIKQMVDQKRVSFLAGDFNIDLPEFNAYSEGFFTRAEDIENTFSSKNPYVVKWWDRKVTTDKKIDYILAKFPDKMKLSFTSKIVDKPVVSDHYGIFSEITLR